MAVLASFYSFLENVGCVSEKPTRRVPLPKLKQYLPGGYFIDSEQLIACEDSEPEPVLAVIRGAEDDFGTNIPSRPNSSSRYV